MFNRKQTVLHTKKYSKAIKIAVAAAAIIISSCFISYGWQKYDEKKYPDGAARDYKLPNAFLDFFQMASDFMNRENDGTSSEDSAESSSLSEQSGKDTHIVVGGDSSESSSAESNGHLPEEPAVKGGVVPEGETASEYAFRKTLFIGDYFVSGIQTENYFTYSSFVYATGYDMNTIQTKSTFKMNGEAMTMAEYVATFENIDTVYVAFSAESVSWMDCPTFVKKYTDFLDYIIAAQPDADIYIQPLLPINEKQAQKRGYSVTNEKIDEINSYLLDIAEKKDIWYLNMTDEFKSGDGAFADEATGNGIRLSDMQYAVWYNYIIMHKIL